MSARSDLSASFMNESLMAVLAALDDGAPAESFVIAQLGQSLDGRIATPTGDSKYINGPIALDFLHHLRARVDGVIVGVGTVMADDPLLTVRRVSGRSPARVIIDPNKKMPNDAKCLSSDGARVYVIRHADDFDAQPCETVAVPPGTDGIDPHAIIGALHEKGLKRLLVEGGAATVSRFLTAGALDRLYVLVTPILLGSGKASLELPPIDKLAEALRPKTRSYSLAGGDVLFECHFQRRRDSV